MQDVRYFRFGLHYLSRVTNLTGDSNPCRQIDKRGLYRCAILKAKRWWGPRCWAVVQPDIASLKESFIHFVRQCDQMA